MEHCYIRILCRDCVLSAALCAAAKTDGFFTVTEADAGFAVLLLDAASLSKAPIERLCVLRKNGVRVFLLLDGYDASIGPYMREAADYLFVLPQSPAAVMRRIRLFMCGYGTAAPLPAPDDAWIHAQTDACLRVVGMPQHLLGYRYMRQGVRFLIACETPMHLSMMRDVYPAVARIENTSPVMVDRAMKHAVEVAWRKGNVLMQHTYFGYSSIDKKGMPTNAEWLYAIADRVRILLCDMRGKDAFTQMLQLLDSASDCGLSVDVNDAAW